MPAHARVLPFLMFEGHAEDAIRFYVSVFPDSRILDIVRYGEGAAETQGTVMKASFSLGGQTIMCTDSVVKHGFTFTPAISFFVNCESEEEIQRIATALSEGGSAFMPLGEY